ncbi:MAG: Spy/CpxP family protein refolding chaperone [Deltaproteobacteria bacterium]
MAIDSIAEVGMKPGRLMQAMTVLAFASLSVAAVQAADTAPAPQQAPVQGSGTGMMGACPGNEAGCNGAGYGSGMMGGYGGGMMGGHGRGMMGGDYGPGMMGRYGPGMMGDYGPGMMGGYGPGMMGGYGRGMMPGYGGSLSQFDLTADQQEKIEKIREDARERNWTTMGQLRTEQFKLRSLYRAEKPDPDAVAEQQKKVDDLRRQLIKARVEAHNEMQAVLTKEQREQLRAPAPWWEEDGDAED